MRSNILVNMRQGDYDALQKKNEEMKVVRTNLIRSFPVIWTLPLAMFASGNLYALWAVSGQAIVHLTIF